MTGRAEQIAALIEDHLSTGLGCRCGEWRIDTSRRPVDPRAQHRRHVADVLAAQEGGRGGADTTTAAVEAVLAEGNLAYWGKVWVTTDDVRAALSDPVGALAKHDAEVLRAAADAWDYPDGGMARTPRTGAFVFDWLNRRADRIEGNQP